MGLNGYVRAAGGRGAGPRAQGAPVGRAEGPGRGAGPRGPGRGGRADIEKKLKKRVDKQFNR